jgi:hypothetical protein
LAVSPEEAVRDVGGASVVLIESMCALSVHTLKAHDSHEKENKRDIARLSRDTAIEKGSTMAGKRMRSHAHSQTDGERKVNSQALPTGSPAKNLNDAMNLEQGDQAVASDGTAGSLVSHAASSLPQNLPQQGGQIDQLVVKLEQRLTQAMQPLLDTLIEEITETARQQIEPAFEPVRHTLQQQIDQVFQPLHEALHQEVDSALQPVRETLQREMDAVVQPIRETILQQVEVALRSSFDQ